MIEPVAEHDFTKGTEQPHIVYKRSPDEFQATATQDFCNVIGDISRIIDKRALNQRKKIYAKLNENKSYTVELLVVLDKSLLDYHRNYDVENYVLTLFNMASRNSLMQKFTNLHLRATEYFYKTFFFLRPRGCIVTLVSAHVYS